jgi:uncharacterized protein (TIGR02996 family)
VKPDLLVLFGPAPYRPEVVMDRLIDVIEAGGGKLGQWYGEIQYDANATGDDDFSVIREAGDLAGRDDLRARIQRNGSGQASYWSRRLLSDDEHIGVFEDPPRELVADLDPAERELARAVGEGDDDASAVYADWLESAGQLDRAELLRLRHAAARGGPSARLRALAQTIDVGWLAHVRANTTTVIHLAAATSSPTGSGVAQFVHRDPQFDGYRRELLAYFEAMATAIDATHFVAGEHMFRWRRLDAERFRAGPSGLLPHHVAWRPDTFALAEAGRWGIFTPGMVEHGPAFDHATVW